MNSAIFLRATVLRRLASLTALVLLPACAVVPSAPQPAPPPPPPPRPAPPPPPPSPPPVDPEKPWDVAPLAAGDWTYRRDSQGTVASFGAAGRVDFEIRCLVGTRQIAVSRAGAAGQATTMTIRTSAGDLKWPAQPAVGRASMVATRPAGDSGLDWIAFSRGRVSVEAPGEARLIVPIWAEVARVIEDCRG